MADPKWVKIQIDMFDHPKLKIIDSMEDNNLIHYIWTSSILLAGRSNKNGELYLSNDMPYTIKTLAIEFRRTVDEVKKAYKVFKKLGMVELTDDKVFLIKGWQEYQNVEGLEKIRKQTNERVSKFREKKREEKKLAEENKKLEKQDSSSKVNDSDNSNNENENSNKLDKDNNKINKNSDINIKNLCDGSNVTSNDDDGNVFEENCVTETQQNKKEIKKKNKKREKDNKENSISQSIDISTDVIELSQYCENITGKVGVLDIGALKLLVNMHGKENVKNSIDKAIELGKINIPYVSGILSNWRKEGYPKEDDIRGNDYGGKCNNKGNEPNTNKLRDFKPKEPRRLSEEERNRASANVI